MLLKRLTACLTEIHKLHSKTRMACRQQWQLGEQLAAAAAAAFAADCFHLSDQREQPTTTTGVLQRSAPTSGTCPRTPPAALVPKCTVVGRNWSVYSRERSTFDTDTRDFVALLFGTTHLLLTPLWFYTGLYFSASLVLGHRCSKFRAAQALLFLLLPHGPFTHVTCSISAERNESVASFKKIFAKKILPHLACPTKCI